MSEVWKSYISSSQMRLLGGTPHMWPMVTLQTNFLLPDLHLDFSDEMSLMLALGKE